MRGDWSCIHCKHEGARGSGATEERYCKHESIEPGAGVIPPMEGTPDWCPIKTLRNDQFQRHLDALLSIASLPDRIPFSMEAANEAVRLAKEAFIPPMRRKA